MSFSTRHLSARQYRGLQKLGDAQLPGDGALPSFSQCGCAEHIDEVLDYMPEDDRDSLKLLLAVLAFVPQPMLVGLIYLLELAPNVPWPLGGPVRFLRMGVKGLALTLYYSGRTGGDYQGPSPLEVIGYQVDVYTGDLPPREAVAASPAEGLK